MEEVFSYIKDKSEESIALCDFPERRLEYEDEVVKSDIDRLLFIRDIVYKAIEDKRKQKIIGDSLEASVFITSELEKDNVLLSKYLDFLSQFFIVSQVYVSPKNININWEYSTEGINVYVSKAKGKKCARCWIYSEEVGKNEEYRDLCRKCISAIKKVEKEVY
jgi:isoleucyl-tRNA synthetase